MSRFEHVAPERLQFREGGGFLSIFGAPFFLAGVFLLLSAVGVVTVQSDDDLGAWMQPPGDSDSSDKFPVALKARNGADFVVCSPTSYDEARTCAAAAATHLGFALEDASGDHAVTLDPADVERPLQQRAASDASRAPQPPRPTAPRSEVHPETAGVGGSSSRRTRQARSASPSSGC